MPRFLCGAGERHQGMEVARGRDGGEEETHGRPPFRTADSPGLCPGRPVHCSTSSLSLNDDLLSSCRQQRLFLRREPFEQCHRMLRPRQRRHLVPHPPRIRPIGRVAEHRAHRLPHRSRRHRGGFEGSTDPEGDAAPGIPRLVGADRDHHQRQAVAEGTEHRAEAPWATTAAQRGSSSAWGIYRSMWTFAGCAPNWAGSMSRPTVTIRRICCPTCTSWTRAISMLSYSWQVAMTTGWSCWDRRGATSVGKHAPGKDSAWRPSRSTGSGDVRPARADARVSNGTNALMCAATRAFTFASPRRIVVPVPAVPTAPKPRAGRSPSVRVRSTKRYKRGVPSR